jgi:hypothetical protein
MLGTYACSHGIISGQVLFFDAVSVLLYIIQVITVPMSMSISGVGTQGDPYTATIF